MSAPTLRTEVVDSAGGTGVRLLIRGLMRVPKNMQAGLRKGLRQAALPILQDASMRATWSSRIPHAMSLRTSFAGRRPGVFITVSQSKAPHARPYEGLLGGRSFRHPVFGHYDRWVEQTARPYLLPALQANEGRAYTAITTAVDEALRRSGMR